MPDEIGPRHAAPHFAHVFGGDGYTAGYYSYLWSEVLDADGFKAFKEAHDPFDPATRAAACTSSSIPPAAPAISPPPIAISAAAIPISRPCWKAAVLAPPA